YAAQIRLPEVHLPDGQTPSGWAPERIISEQSLTNIFENRLDVCYRFLIMGLELFIASQPRERMSKQTRRLSKEALHKVISFLTERGELVNEEVSLAFIKQAVNYSPQLLQLINNSTEPLTE